MLLIGGLLLAAFLALGLKFLLRQEGAALVVRVNGSEVARYDLTETGDYPLNGGTNVLHIENGSAWLTDADCPDKLCVKQGKIQYTGQTITCLPNRLTVTVIGADGLVVSAADYALIADGANKSGLKVSLQQAEQTPAA